jgi:hypothetical protein
VNPLGIALLIVGIVAFVFAIFCVAVRIGTSIE